MTSRSFHEIGNPAAIRARQLEEEEIVAEDNDDAGDWLDGDSVDAAGSSAPLAVQSSPVVPPRTTKEDQDQTKNSLESPRKISTQGSEIERELASLRAQQSVALNASNEREMSASERAELERKKELDEIARIRAAKKQEAERVTMPSSSSRSQGSEIARELEALRNARSISAPSTEERELSHAEREELERQKELAEISKLRAQREQQQQEETSEHVSKQELQVEKELERLHNPKDLNQSYVGQEDVLSHAEREELERQKELAEISKLRAQREQQQQEETSEHVSKQELQVEKELERLHNPEDLNQSNVGQEDVLSHAEREEVENQKELDFLQKMKSANKSDSEDEQNEDDDWSENEQPGQEIEVPEPLSITADQPNDLNDAKNLHESSVGQQDVSSHAERDQDEKLDILQKMKDANKSSSEEDQGDNWSEDDETKPNMSTSMTLNPSNDANHEKYVALYDFTSEVESDLNFKEGDIIVKLSPIDDTWWNGRCESTGAQGMFPMNYVEPYKEENSLKELPEKDDEKISSQEIEENDTDVSTSPQSNPEKYIAKFDFASQEPEDLPFNQGDIIFKLDNVDEQWWRGRLERNGAEGIFPKSYVGEFDAVEETKADTICLALYDFPGETEEDLSFVVNDEINVLEKIDENWWRGRNIRTGNEGLFPKTYVQT